MAGRSDTLAAIFLLPSLLCWLAWKRHRRNVLLLLAALLFLGGLLVKETAIGFLAIILATDLLGIDGALPGERDSVGPPPALETGGSAARRKGKGAGRGKKVRSNGPHPQAPAQKGFAAAERRGFMDLLPGWALLAVAVALYFWMRSTALAVEPGRLVAQKADAVETFLNVVRAVGFYLAKVFVPVGLDAYIPVIPNPGRALVLGGLGLAAALIAGLLAWKAGQRTIVFLGLWFFGALAPSLAIAVFAISEAPVAERYMYIPSAAFCLLAAYLAIVKLPGLVSDSLSRTALYGGAGAIVLIGASYALGTVERAKVWASDLEFWEDGVAKSPNEGLAHLHLGLAYANLGKDDLAVKEYDLAIDPKVDYDVEGRSIALNNLGMLYMGKQDFDKAEEYFQRSIQMRSDYPTPYYGMGVTSVRRGEALVAADRRQEAETYLRRAEQYLRRALELNPQYVKAHNQLARLLINMGRTGEAEAHVNEVLRRVASGQEHDLAVKLSGIIASEKAGGTVTPGPGGASQPGGSPGGSK